MKEDSDELKENGPPVLCKDDEAYRSAICLILRYIYLYFSLCNGL